MPESESVIHLNGIDGVTGEYLVSPMSSAEAAGLARGVGDDTNQSSWLKRIWQAMQRPFMGLPLEVDPCDVQQAGWAIVFGPDTPAEVQDALQPLISHRQSRIPPDRCKILEYRRGDELKDWLKRQGVYPGTVSPSKLPYYVLLVGSPEDIPFSFQYLLDIEYAVGRLSFDEPAQYRQYAESVVEYESAQSVASAREIVYWAARHAADRATQISADYLVKPLFEGVPESDGRSLEAAIAQSMSFESRCFFAQDATKSNLAELIHPAAGKPRPAMLFTASHGMGWPMEHEHHEPAQGALLCQDWSGFGSVDNTQFLANADIDDDAQVHGLVAFLFACYGAGTPAFDHFLSNRSSGPVSIAEKSSVAGLPQRLLSHPQGSALAVLGHVDRAWGYSIRPPGVGAQLQPYRNLIGRILTGQPVGHATKDFSDRYAVLSSELASKLDFSQTENPIPDNDLARNWIERNDAQNYIMLGDPAVRLRVDKLVKS